MNIKKCIFVIVLCTITFPVLALDTFSTCDIRGNTQFEDYTVSNDAWGINKLKGDPKTTMICISSNISEDASITMKAIWNMGEPQHTVLAYPRISYGWDFNDHSSTKNLPIKISKITYLTSKAHYIITAYDRFNVSYDIWLSQQETPKKEDLKVEMMIWTDWQNASPPGKKISTVQLGDETYDIYKGKVSLGDWDYIAVVINYKNKETIVKSLTDAISNRIQSSKNIDIKKILDMLIEQRVINNDYYLNGISFGSEIQGGSGVLNIESYQVKITSN